MGGESYYFVKLEKGKTYYKVSASSNEAVVILNIGDSVSLTYVKGAGGNVIEASLG